MQERLRCQDSQSVIGDGEWVSGARGKSGDGGKGGCCPGDDDADEAEMREEVNQRRRMPSFTQRLALASFNDTCTRRPLHPANLSSPPQPPPPFSRASSNCSLLDVSSSSEDGGCTRDGWDHCSLTSADISTRRSQKDRTLADRSSAQLRSLLFSLLTSFLAAFPHPVPHFSENR